MSETDIFSYLEKRRDFTYRVRMPTDSVVTEIEADPTTVHIRKTYEVESVLNEARKYQKLNESNKGFTQLRHFRLTAIYPTAVWLKLWKQSQGDAKEYRKLIKGWLKEHSKFLTVPPNTI